MKVAIAGYDVEGQASYRYFADQGAEITIFDEAEALRVEAPQGVRLVLGKDSLETLKQESFDLVMRTPGLSPSKLQGVNNVSSGTKEFLHLCPAPIIGITGTKGKGTTASLIASILKAAGKTVHLVGNIGQPALGVLPVITPEDVVVYEMSSFQLWDVDSSPHIAVVLMIEPDHLDNHSGMDDYVEAKGNITRYQKGDDLTIYYVENEHSKRIGSLSGGKTIAFPTTASARVEGGNFVINEQIICSISAMQIPGVHNLDNACAAITAVWQFTQDNQAIERGLSSFTGLPHRLKFVREVGGVKYYDDSIATTPGSAIAATKAFNGPKILILGGSDKGADFNGLAEELAKAKGLKSILCIGQTGPKIAEALKAHGLQEVTITDVKNMKSIVDLAASMAAPGDTVILSPSCASFDMFKSYSDRGDQFIAAVEVLGQ